MVVHADLGKCQGHSLCHTFAPDLFPVDDDGYLAVEQITVGAADEALAARAVGMCPERALTLEQ